MHSQLIISIFIILCIDLVFLPISYSQNEYDFQTCFTAFNCGKVENLMYPFWNSKSPATCHEEGFQLSRCEEDVEPIIRIGEKDFRLISWNMSARSMIIARNDLWEQVCPQNWAMIDNITLEDSDHLTYSETNQHLTFFYNCSPSVELPSSSKPFQCIGDVNSRSFYADDEDDKDKYEEFFGSCKRAVQVMVNESVVNELPSGNDQIQSWRTGFGLEYDLQQIFCSKCNSLPAGSCASLVGNDYPFCKAGGEGINWEAKLGIGLGALFAGIIATIIYYYYRQRRGHGKPLINKWPFISGSTSKLSLMVDPEKGDKSIVGVHLFTYEELEKATCNFDPEKQLGDGGFGTVYYGKLQDGRNVAVKLLYENNYKRVEQFLNEVEILTRLRHRNLVSLYGCTSRHSRELLLVYEYIPNGTVADHLHGERAKPGGLPWSIRLQIAIETADALTYLHASDTIHRDVKTNNILLDNNFSVKVADFGLSRLFPNNVTHVSTAPQGTPGYVDPEYHQCYQLTDKSDVFSFGVVLIELISSKPAVDITRHRHEINLSNMAINKIQNRALHELVDQSLGFESDYKVRKMITSVAEVAFQCLQSEKDMRPNMAQVLESLICIQNVDHNNEKAEEMNLAEEDVLSKSGPIIPHSPDLVMTNWPINSASTTSSV